MACTKLKKLNLSSNQIGVIPEEVSQCSELQQLDLYNNPIGDLGQGLHALKNLVELDLRGLMMNANKQREIAEKMPHVRVLFDSPCNCVD
jgi:Ran GTPase-activating protein (RanGAP) involved in mRNA processing and transport